MNLFILDNDPIKAAQLQCDKHVVKMILESAQMLSTVHRMLDGKLYTAPSNSGKRMVKKWSHPVHDDVLYKAVHMYHPCTEWTIESDTNYKWHYTHFIALCDEYTYRYGKVHSSDTKLRKVLKSIPTNIVSKSKTEFRLAMGSNPECMHPGDAVRSYREFYMTKQSRFKMTWTGRSIPSWFIS